MCLRMRSWKLVVHYSDKIKPMQVKRSHKMNWSEYACLNELRTACIKSVWMADVTCNYELYFQLLFDSAMQWTCKIYMYICLCPIEYNLWYVMNATHLNRDQIRLKLQAHFKVVHSKVKYCSFSTYVCGNSGFKPITCNWIVLIPEIRAVFDWQFVGPTPSVAP